MPRHSHPGRFKNAWTATGRGSGNWFASGAYYWASNEEYNDIPGVTTAVGNGEAHNNLQPYKAIYFWLRVS